MPRIVVLATGGTIAATRGADGALAPALGPSELAAFAPRADIEVEAHAFLSVDSAAMTPAHIAAIAAQAARAADRADGVVVLHGTDTMTESALAADLAPALTAERAPIVFTGAQRSADSPAPDGPSNLALAFEVASSGAFDEPDADPRSVSLAFCGAVLPAWGTRKIHTLALDGFAPWPDRARARETRTRALSVLRRLHARHRLQDPGPAAAPHADAAPPRVDTVAVYPGADGTAVGAFLAAGARGIVLEAMGAGNANPTVVTAVRTAVAAGVPVVVTTRVPWGPAFADYGGGGGGADLASAGAVFSPVLRAGQSRALLVALLSAGAGPADVAAAFGG